MIPMFTEDLVRAIRDEWQRTETKYPGATVHSTVWSDAERHVILAEEVGEVADAVSLTLGDYGAPRDAAVRAELIQVAAVALAWVQRIDLDAANGVDEL